MRWTIETIRNARKQKQNQKNKIINDIFIYSISVRSYCRYNVCALKKPESEREENVNPTAETSDKRANDDRDAENRNGEQQ